MRFTEQQLNTAISTALTTGSSLQDVLADLEPKIITGDVVRLKSGGPLMTAQLAFDHAVECKWFDGLTVREERFHPASLKKAARP